MTPLQSSRDLPGVVFTGKQKGQLELINAHSYLGVNNPVRLEPTLTPQTTLRPNTKASSAFTPPASSPSIISDSLPTLHNGMQQKDVLVSSPDSVARPVLNLKLPILFGVLRYSGNGNVSCQPLPTSFSTTTGSRLRVDYTSVSTKQALRDWERGFWGYTYKIYNLTQADSIAVQFVIWDKATRNYTGTGVISLKDGQDGVSS